MVFYSQKRKIIVSFKQKNLEPSIIPVSEVMRPDPSVTMLTAIFFRSILLTYALLRGVLDKNWAECSLKIKAQWDFILKTIFKGRAM